MAVFIEFMVGAALAIFFHRVHHDEETAKDLHLYELIEHSAQALMVEDDKIILPSDAVALAS